MFIPYASTDYPLRLVPGTDVCRAGGAIPVHRGAPYKLKLMDCLMAELTSTYRQLSFTLHPAFTDMRSFLWWNYHDERGGRCAVHLRYTGLVDLMAETQAQWLSGIRQLRRRELKRARGQGIQCESSSDVALLEHLDDLVYQRQGFSRSSEERAERKKIAEQAMREGFGRCIVARTADGEPASAHLFLYYERCAYHLFAGNHPEFRKSGASTLLICSAVEMFREEGKEFFDSIGLNSPQRGDFKTSFRRGSHAPFSRHMDAPESGVMMAELRVCS